MALRRLLGGSSEPLHYGFFCHAQDTAKVGPRDFPQEPLQRHPALRFRGPEVTEDRIARFREGLLPGATPAEPLRATLGEGRRERPHVAAVHQPLMAPIR